MSTSQTEGLINDVDFIGKINEPLVFVAGQTSRKVTVTILDRIPGARESIEK